MVVRDWSKHVVVPDWSEDKKTLQRTRNLCNIYVKEISFGNANNFAVIVLCRRKFKITDNIHTIYKE